MKTKLIFTSGKHIYECWTEMPFTPRMNEWINVRDIFLPEEIKTMMQKGRNWSGHRGVVQSVEYRHDGNEFYPELHILCEDQILVS